MSVKIQNEKTGAWTQVRHLHPGDTFLYDKIVCELLNIDALILKCGALMGGVKYVAAEIGGNAKIYFLDGNDDVELIHFEGTILPYTEESEFDHDNEEGAKPWKG